MRTFILPVCMFVAFLSVSLGFRNGAPMMVCDTMQPSPAVHGSARDNTNQPAPYNLSCFQNEDNDNQIIVEVEGSTEEERFKGILLEIRSGPNGKMKLGKFDKPEDRNFQLRCRGDTGVTHSNSANKEFARFTAVLSDEELGRDPHCVVTIVKTLKVHWDKLAFPVEFRPGFEIEESVEEEGAESAVSTGGLNGVAEAEVSSTFDASSFNNGGSFSFSDFSDFLDLGFER